MPHLRALIVEDCPLIRDQLIAALEEFAQVDVVGSVADETSARRWVRESADCFDIIVIDVFLDAGSGLAVLREARDARIQAKRIVLTNDATAAMREFCRLLGADRVFDKSSELEALIAYCHRIGDGVLTTPGELM